jgi:catecholate siderophore receptor
MWDLAALTFALVLAAPAKPAETAGTLRGTVLDTSRAPIRGALVIASGRQVAVTDDRGVFSVRRPAGECEVRIVSPGFDDSVRSLALPADRTLEAEFVMEISRVRQSVDVTAAAPLSVAAIRSATRTLTPLRDVPQSVGIATKEQIKDQLLTSIADVVRYIPGVGTHQGENNRDQIVMRGNSSSADFFLDGVRDDVQYYRDLYNVDRVEALKGPNAMVFGRGGGGGVINRVTKEALFQPLAEMSLQGGSFGRQRLAADVGRALGTAVALRLNGMIEESDSFRDAVRLDRYGLNPTITVLPGPNTRLTFGYEHLHDARVADRGIPSYEGRPVDVDISTFFGDPTESRVRAGVDLATAMIEQRVGRFTVRNRTLAGHYDRSYQNFVPGAVTPDGRRVSLSSYNNATMRDNLFNQTDVTADADTGPFRHTLLAGLEIGRQATENFRNTGYFDNTATSITVPLAAPTVQPAVTFRQSATDADNDVHTTVAAAYAQDQVALLGFLQVVAGVRFERFDLGFRNHRTSDLLQRRDDLVSPRAGLVYKPLAAVSAYASYAVSYLPSSGDQFASLTSVTAQVEPEKFSNYEVGIKWDAAADLALTAALYRLDRTNTRSIDPADATRIVQTGRQRTTGVELALSGRLTDRWRLTGGYAFQDAVVTDATAAARAGARVAQVPRHTSSVWSSYQVARRLGLGAGIVHRTDMFAAIDNTVVLPGFTRVDAAAYFAVHRHLRLQVNVENLFDRKYYVNADNNTNISPGYPRALRVGLTTAF